MNVANWAGGHTWPMVPRLDAPGVHNEVRCGVEIGSYFAREVAKLRLAV